MARIRKTKLPKLDVRPDTLNFRDLVYTPTLVEVPTRIQLSTCKKWQVPILNRGHECAYGIQPGNRRHFPGPKLNIRY